MNTVAANLYKANTGAVAPPTSELAALSAEIVDLFCTQAFSPEELNTEAAVCEAFANILLRHWELCCIATFLQDDGHLRESAIYTRKQIDSERARQAARLLAVRVEREGGEQQVWLDEADGRKEMAEMRCAFVEADLRAGIAVPIHARGQLVGAHVALAAFPDRLHAALRGVRFVAAPIVIAIGNARRASAVREQRKHIEHLVEELQRHSAALEEANRELQRVARYRSLFLARMSHELRTPLTSMLGFAEILLDQENLNDDQQRFCEKIQASGLQLQASLNQLVDLSRLEAGQTELFLHEFSLKETLRDSCAAVRRIAQKHGVKIDCISALEFGSVVSDEGKLRQVLYNFLAYAISRSPVGASVTVRVEIIEPSHFSIQICDQGEPLIDLAHLFEPVETEALNERGTNMNELGLSIAHRLVHVLGGSVALESPESCGLSITIELPVSPTGS
ncbi:MAG: HAMP domain-containing histidine kinase [Pyrinomonadaceae bacterium]|nr:HAMP domain-containing histidine kinase [Pyrinomonadaceae bacterium]